MTKKWYASKTLWVNVIAIIGIAMGFETIPADIQLGVLAAINLILRIVTKEAVEW